MRCFHQDVRLGFGNDTYRHTYTHTYIHTYIYKYPKFCSESLADVLSYYIKASRSFIFHDQLSSTITAALTRGAWITARHNNRKEKYSPLPNYTLEC